MNLYMASSLAWGYPADESIRIAKAHGLDGVEIWAEHVFYHQTEAEKIAEAAKELGIELTLHASSWDLNICSMNQGILKQSVREIESSIDLACKLGAKDVTLHPGRLTAGVFDAKQHEARLVDSLSMLDAYAWKRGITLSIELMEPVAKEFITKPEAMNRVLAQLPGRVCTTFDIAHVPLDRSPLRDLYQLKQTSKIHLSDSSVHTYHLPLGQGEIHLEPVLKHLELLELPVVLEGYEDGRELTFLKAHLDYLNKHNRLKETLC